MNRPFVRTGINIGIALALTVVSACGNASTEASSSCRYDPRPPLPDDVRQPERVIIARAKRIFRHAATTDRRSGLVQVLAGSGYRIEEFGPWQISDKPGHGRQFRYIGAFVNIALNRPHPVDAVVSAVGDAWPVRSGNYRYSRRYGYVEYRAHLVSPSLTGLSILVDLRRGRVAEVDGGPDPDVTRNEPVPGHCPRPPRPAD